MTRFLVAGVCLGALTLLGTVLCLVKSGFRVYGVVAGAAGIAGGALAALTYTLFFQLRGVDIEAIPEGRVADWFVTAFGLAGGTVFLASALLPSIRGYLRKSWGPARS